MTNQRPTYAEYRERLRQKAQEREIKDALQKKRLQERLKEHAVIALRDQIMLKLRLGQRLTAAEKKNLPAGRAKDVDEVRRHTLQEIGHLYGITRERVRQVVARTLLDQTSRD